MSNPSPPDKITAGKVELIQRGDQIVLVYPSKTGPVSVVVDAAKLERWAMRIMRDEAFA